MKGVKDIERWHAGAVFGQRTLTGGVLKLDDNVLRVPCVCKCGRFDYVAITSLRKNKSTRCQQCAISEGAYTKHGLAQTRAYSSWKSMMERCYNKRHVGYKNYGGRGVIVESEWHSCVRFFEDMGERSEGMSLDRKDGNSNYGPGLCKWSTATEQNRNQRNNVWISAYGKRLLAGDWEKITGVKRRTIQQRVKKGWNPEKAVTELSAHQKQALIHDK